MAPRPLASLAAFAAATATAVTLLSAPLAGAQTTGSDADGPIGQIGGLVSGSAEPAGSVFGSAGPLATPLGQTLGSANGSVSNPGPAAPIDVTVGCRPTAAHPRPVILLHGTYGNDDQMDTTRIGKTLAARGFCTIAPTYGAYAFAPRRGGLASAEEVSGPQVAELIDKVLAATGAAQVDLVGFSQGAAIAGYTTKVLRPGKVGHVASFAGYWGNDPSSMLPGGISALDAGSLLGVANLGGIADLLPTSSFRTAWYGPEGTPFARGVDYTLIASTYDPVMPPAQSFTTREALAAGRAQGAKVTETVLQTGCSVDHAVHDTIVEDPRVADLVTNALEPTRPVPVTCAAFG